MPADGVGHAIVVDAVVAAFDTGWMKTTEPRLVGGLPEWYQRRIVEHAADALGLGCRSSRL